MALSLAIGRGVTVMMIAGITGYSADWICRIARRDNQHGPEGVKNLRHRARPGTRLLSAAQQAELQFGELLEMPHAGEDCAIVDALVVDEGGDTCCFPHFGHGDALRAISLQSGEL